MEDSGSVQKPIERFERLERLERALRFAQLA
jgi:hypothetical protein